MQRMLGVVIRASIGKSRPWSASKPFLHCQNHAELRLPAQHPRVRLGRALERIGLDHGTHAGELGEAQGVLGISLLGERPGFGSTPDGDHLVTELLGELNAEVAEAADTLHRNQIAEAELRELRDRQPKVNANVSTPGSRNSISNSRSAMAPGCRIS